MVVMMVMVVMMITVIIPLVVVVMMVMRRWAYIYLRQLHRSLVTCRGLCIVRLEHGGGIRDRIQQFREGARWLRELG